jgi:hypothetical protein
MLNIILKTNVVISYLCCLGLTKCCLLSFRQIILSVSPAAAKKQKQQLQMSPESKEVLRKERKIKHQAESAKEAAKQKRKNRDSIVRNRQAESAEEAAKQKKEDRNSNRRKQVEVNAIH